MSKVELLNQYLANLAVWNIKLHNLHWNVVGNQFIQLHNFTEEMYDELFEAFDRGGGTIKNQWRNATIYYG